MKRRPYFSHYRLGYRCNPFGALTEDEWTAVAILPPAIRCQLKSDAHLQLLGQIGCGKTTTLLKLAQHFSLAGEQVAYEYLPEGQVRFHSRLHDIDLFLLDEAQRLSWRQRQRWLKLARKRRFIFSSHRDLSNYFARKDLPLVTVDIETQITRDHYASWLDNRLAYFALPNMPQMTFAPDAVEYLFDRFGTNMRAAEYFLYEVWQQLTEVVMITADMLYSNSRS